jgi:hypothetical protein
VLRPRLDPEEDLEALLLLGHGQHCELGTVEVCQNVAPARKTSLTTGLWIRIQSGFNGVSGSGSGFGIRIRIQGQEKEENEEKIKTFILKFL